MTFGLGLGLALIASCQIILVMGLAYLVTGRWLTGKLRANVSAAIAAAYFVGRLHQEIAETGWEAIGDWRVLTVLLTYVAAILLFALRTNKAEQIANS